MADGDFYSKHTGEEIEKILDGSVLFNEYQKLSEIQKQQARRNIGAGTVDSGLIIKGYYATYEELAAAQPNPQISDAYGVGTAAPYDIYVWDNVNKFWVNNGTITKGEKGDPGQDGESPTKENITSALGYTPAATNLSNVTDGSVVTKKLADSAVTRAKLAQDALYSPFIGFDATGVKTISNSDIGRTIRPINGKTDYTINVSRDASIPAGAEIAIFRQQAKTLNIVFASGTRVAIPGETTYKSAPTLAIGDFEMVALKKLASDSNYDYWLVTGNVEVVG